MKTAIFIMLLGGSLRAQTNLSFDVLSTRQGDFTNATIIRTTADYALVMHPGGLTRVALSNLPSVLQDKFHCDPNQGAAQVDAAKKKAEESRRARVEQQKRLAALAGPVQNIRVTTILDDYGLCQIQTGNRTARVIVLGLPAWVYEYYGSRGNLESAIANLQLTPVVVTATSRGYGRATAWVAHQVARETLGDANAIKAERLKYLGDQLADLKKNELQYTTIAAYPTGFSVNGVPRWQAVQ